MNSSAICKSICSPRYSNSVSERVPKGMVWMTYVLDFRVNFHIRIDARHQIFDCPPHLNIIRRRA